MQHQRLLRLPEVSNRVGLSRSPILSRVKAGTFPQPIMLSRRATAWIESEVDQWIESQIKANRGAA